VLPGRIVPMGYQGSNDADALDSRQEGDDEPVAVLTEEGQPLAPIEGTRRRRHEFGIHRILDVRSLDAQPLQDRLSLLHLVGLEAAELCPNDRLACPGNRLGVLAAHLDTLDDFFQGDLGTSLATRMRSLDYFGSTAVWFCHDCSVMVSGEALG